MENKLFIQCYEASNIYLAYLRVKNSNFNSELILPQELIYFEKKLDANIEKISNQLKAKDYTFQKFDFLLKIKKIEDNNVIHFRPIVRYRFYDLVLMQSVFNIVFKELKNFLPKENLGIQLDYDNSPYLYKEWQSQYKKFTQKQRENLSADSLYQYTYEYDIKQFYPSIEQENLIKELSTKLKNDEIMAWVKKIIKSYNSANISECTKEIFEIYKSCLRIKNENNIQYYFDDLGLPQGPLFSPFLSSFYTRNIFKNIKHQIKKEFGVECEYFSYVDDGRVYFKEIASNDESIKDELDTIFNNYLKQLNPGEKKIMINPDKCCFLRIDEESIVSKLNVVNSEISLTNLSVDQRFNIDEDVQDALFKIHKNLTENLIIQYNNLSSKTNDHNKFKKFYSMYDKRKKNALSKKIISDREFQNLVNTIFKYSLDPTTENNIVDDVPLTTLGDLNLYYVLTNLVANADTDFKKRYILNSVFELLESYKKIFIAYFEQNKFSEEDSEKNSKMCLLYYELILLRIMTMMPYKFYKENKAKIFNEQKENDLKIKFICSSKNEEWLSKYINQKEFKEIIHSLSEMVEKTKDTEYKAISECIKKLIVMFPYDYECFKNYKIEYGKKADYDYELVYSYNKDKLYICQGVKDNHEFLFKFEGKGEEYQFINSIQLNEKNLIHSLKLLLVVWKKKYTTNKYISLNYLNASHILLNPKDQSIEIFVIDNLNENVIKYKMNIYLKNYQKLLKQFFLEIFHMDDTNLVIDKNENPLKFWQYRIIAYLKNSYGFKINEFFEMLEDVLEKYDFYNYQVDINFEKVRKIVQFKLGNNRDRDIILQLHYYLFCIWKNGSRDLPFYTLHNQEHSLELIKNFERISQKSFTDLRLGKNEIFLLFASCYLHDIGMLKGLSQKELYNISDERIIKKYRKIAPYFEKNVSLKMEYLLSKSYSISDEIFALTENIVRGDHPKRSALEIEHNHLIPLNDLEKHYTAIISRNHGEDKHHMYGTFNKKEFRNREVDLRKISLWLRLLDLTDISKYRVTQEVFDQYYERMGVVSRFHWVKHLSVDGIDFQVEYAKGNNSITKLGKLNLYIKIILNYIPPEETLEYDSKDCFIMKNHENYYKRDHDNKCEKCNLRCYYLNQFKFFDDEVDAINEYLRINQKNLQLHLQYHIDDVRDDFVVIRDPYNREYYHITATECIKEYYEYNHS